MENIAYTIQTFKLGRYHIYIYPCTGIYNQTKLVRVEMMFIGWVISHIFILQSHVLSLFLSVKSILLSVVGMKCLITNPNRSHV